MNRFYQSTTSGTWFKYGICFMNSTGKHYQPVCNISRCFKELKIFLQIASLTFFQDGEHTFRIKRECETLYLPTLP